ncbi:MAG: putative Ig domain-containing protein, partial [Chitinivibrionales bacterium]
MCKTINKIRIEIIIILLFLVSSLNAKIKDNSTLTYSTNPATFMAGSNITPDTPSTFGSFTSYSISPSPPFYLFFDTTTGILSGIPAAAPMPAAVYTIVANNGVIFDTAKLTITVFNPPPTNLTYPMNPVTYPLGVQITWNLPTFNGIADSFSISPPLPPGLVFGQIAPGSISGAPTVGASTPTATIYTIVASNESGSDTTKLSITIPVVIPTNLTYSTNPAIYVVNTPITANTPSSQGSAIASYSILPKLPMFLKFDTTTGILSGTPATSIPQTPFTIIATNFAGSDTIKLSITIIPIAPPIKLSYNSDTLNFIVGTSQAYTPFVQGGAVASYSITPPLSDSLTFDTSTGII